jgi:hypothetical protein
MTIRLRSLVAALLVAVTLALLAGAAVASAASSEFSGTEYWVENLPVGTVSFPGGTFQARGLRSVYRDVVGDPRLSGTSTVRINFSFRPAPAPATWTGPLWGTFRLENAGGFWEGSWTGERDADGFLTVRAVGRGGGAYAGQHVRMQIRRPSPDPTAPASLTGTVLDPGRRP